MSFDCGGIIMVSSVTTIEREMEKLFRNMKKAFKQMLSNYYNDPMRIRWE
jgi:hypothetical protein